MKHSLKAFIYLMRLHKPIGIYLLWYPTAWALWLSQAPLTLYLWFGLGTLVMRSAGCIINDIADRRWDGLVERTRYRPLANQSIKLLHAWLLFIFLLFLALLILIQLPKNCFYGALPAAGLTLIYPFCKRFFATPQLILSLAFSSSISMVFLIKPQPWTLSWTLLQGLSILWIIAYDTEYAMVDLKDDIKVGIHSSARFFGRYVIQITLLLLTLSHLSWLGIAYRQAFHLYYYFGWSLGIGFICYQAILLIRQTPFKAFLHNSYYGLWMWGILFLN